MDRDQTVRLRIRERAEHHAVHDAEDGGVGADAECQRQTRDDAEDRRPHQRARGVSYVAPEHLDPNARAHVAHTLLHLRDASGAIPALIFSSVISATYAESSRSRARSLRSELKYVISGSRAPATWRP